MTDDKFLENANFCSESPSGKYVTYQWGDCVRCYDKEKTNCYGEVSNPFDYGVYHKTEWYEHYGFVKIEFLQIELWDFRVRRIYMDKELYRQKCLERQASDKG